MDEKDIIDDILNLRTSDSLFISFHAENLPSHYSGVMGGALRCAKTVTLVKRTNYMMINEEGDCGWVTVRSWMDGIVVNKLKKLESIRKISSFRYA